MTARLARLATAASAALALAAGLPQGPAAAAGSFNLSGHLDGKWTSASGNPDQGGQITLRAFHGATTLGSNTQASGRSGSIGFVQQANCDAIMTLSTASPSGTMHVHIRSKRAYGSGFLCHSYAFTFRVISETGAYSGKTDTGYGWIKLAKDGTGVVQFNP